MPNHFDADAEAIVVEPFTYSGERYEAKTVFPHKLLGVEVNTTLYGLFLSGRIRFDYTKRAQLPEPKSKAKGKDGKQPNA